MDENNLNNIFAREPRHLPGTQPAYLVNDAWRSFVNAALATRVLDRSTAAVGFPTRQLGAPITTTATASHWATHAASFIAFNAVGASVVCFTTNMRETKVSGQSLQVSLVVRESTTQAHGAVQSMEEAKARMHGVWWLKPPALSAVGKCPRKKYKLDVGAQFHSKTCTATVLHIQGLGQPSLTTASLR